MHLKLGIGTLASTRSDSDSRNLFSKFILCAFIELNKGLATSFGSSELHRPTNSPLTIVISDT